MTGAALSHELWGSTETLSSKVMKLNMPPGQKIINVLMIVCFAYSPSQVLFDPKQ